MGGSCISDADKAAGDVVRELSAEQAIGRRVSEAEIRLENEKSRLKRRL
jgi:hypothetical protein